MVDLLRWIDGVLSQWALPQLGLYQAEATPLWKKYHTIACCISSIFFWMELIETKKDSSKEGPHATLEIEGAMPKTATLCVQMTKSIWGTKRVCLLNSRFGYMSTLPELEKHGIYGTMVLKQKGVGWPKGSDTKCLEPHARQGCGISGCPQGKQSWLSQH